MGGYTMALPILRKAAELGSTDAMFYLGVAYDNGRGVQVDKAAAFGWFKKAARPRERCRPVQLRQYVPQG